MIPLRITKVPSKVPFVFLKLKRPSQGSSWFTLDSVRIELSTVAPTAAPTLPLTYCQSAECRPAMPPSVTVARATSGGTYQGRMHIAWTLPGVTEKQGYPIAAARVEAHARDVGSTQWENRGYKTVAAPAHEMNWQTGDDGRVYVFKVKLCTERFDDPSRSPWCNSWGASEWVDSSEVTAAWPCASNAECRDPKKSKCDTVCTACLEDADCSSIATGWECTDGVCRSPTMSYCQLETRLAKTRAGPYKLRVWFVCV